MLAHAVVAAAALFVSATAEASEDYDDWAARMSAGADMKAAAAAERDRSQWWRFLAMAAIGLASAAVIMIARNAAQRAARSQLASRTKAREQADGAASRETEPAPPRAASPAARRGPGSGKRKKRAD